MAAGVTAGSQQTLADVVATGAPLSLEAALDILRPLVTQLADLHDSGRVHLGIRLEAISVGPDGISLPTAETPARLEVVREIRDWSATELRRLPKEMPTDCAAAGRALAAADISVDPRSLDLMALGDVLCRLLTGRAAAAYRQSGSVKNLIPVPVRPVLERLLEADGRTGYADARELLQSLRRIASPPATEAIRTSDAAPATSTEDTAVNDSGLVRLTNDTAVESIARTNWPETDAELPFHKLGHFEIQARIGHGGMGDVYRGYERSLDRIVAIKVLPAEFARQPDFIRRFQAEATAAARLMHPNIIQIYFIGEDGGYHFFAMQYVDGYSLAVLLERQKKLNVNTSVALVEQVLHGLAEAHARGFVHRDIKPANILIDKEQQRALLADFGLVKEAHGSQTGKTATGVILGTVDYISPEQARGADVDGRSDLYSVGVLLYHMLSGQLPFSADSPTALIFQHVYEHPRPLAEVAPHVPEPLATIVGRLMRKKPANRYQSARDVLTDLTAFRNDRPLTIAPQLPDDSAVELRRGEMLFASISENFSLPSSLAFDTNAALEKAGWQRWLNRWRAKFQQHAPQALLDLQNTQQQIGGAIAIYETRRGDLEKLLAEARELRQELADSARASRGKSDETTMQRQLAEQDEQLEELQLQLAKVTGTLQQLVSQRDLVNARLKAVGARMKSDGRIDVSRAWYNRKAVRVAFAAAALLMVMVLLKVIRFRPTQPVAPITPPVVAVDSPPVVPEHVLVAPTESELQESVTLLQSGEEQFAAGNWEEALSLAERSLKKQPDQTEAHVLAMKSAIPLIKREFRMDAGDLRALRRAMEHYLRAMEHLLAFYQAWGVDEQLGSGKDEMYTQLRGAVNSLKTIDMPPRAAREYMETVRARNRQLLFQIFEVQADRNMRWAGYYLIESFDRSLPADELLRLRQELTLQYQDSPRAFDIAFSLGKFGYSADSLDNPEGEAYLATLEKQGNAKIREAVAALRADIIRVKADRQKLFAPPPQLEPVPPGAPRVQFSPLKLEYADEASGLHELTYFIGLISTAKNLDLYWTDSEIYLQAQPDRLERVWQANGPNWRLKPLLSSICYDGRYIWAAVECEPKPSRLVVIDPKSKQSFEFTPREGLPHPATVEIPMDQSKPSLRLAAIRPGRVFVAGSIGYAWLGFAEYDAETGGKVSVVHTATESPDPTDAEQWRKATVTFTPLDVIAVRETDSAAPRILVVRDWEKVDLNYHPLVFDTATNSVSVYEHALSLHNHQSWNVSPDEVLALQYNRNQGDFVQLQRCSASSLQFDFWLKTPSWGRLVAEPDRIHFVARQWWIADRAMKKLTPAGPVPWTYDDDIFKVPESERKSLKVLARSAYHGIVAHYTNPKGDPTTLRATFTE